MITICRGHRTLVTLLIAALMFASTIINSHGRPLSALLVAREEDDKAELIKSALELSSRDEMVLMAGYGEEKLSTVLITGIVLCNKACLRGYNRFPPQPISGALVAATCQTSNTEKTQINGAKAVTDKYGEFMIDLPSELHAIQNLDKACSVEVLQLPKNSPCRQSGFAKEHTAIRLSSVENGARTYAAGTITFYPKTSKACKKAMDYFQKM